MMINNEKKEFRLFGRSVVRAFTIAAICCLSVFAEVTVQSTGTDSTSDFVTSNGLKVIHRRVQGNEVVAVQIYFRGGARNITEKNAGIESLMFDVAQQGTRSFSKYQINRELARMGTAVDSAGGYDYSVVAMKCVRRNFAHSWQILSDVVLNPLFEEKEVALAKDQLVNGLRQQNDVPESQVALISSNLLYKSHPYINSPDGTIDSVSGLTAADLKAHHAKLLQTSRMTVVIVGNFTLEEVKERVETTFGKLPRGNYDSAAPPLFSNAAHPEFQIVEKGVKTNYIRGTFAAPPLNHPDYPAFYVAVNILGQLFFQEVRVKRNLTYTADATLLTNEANSGFLVVTTAKPNETISVMFDQIDFLQRNVLRDEGLRSLIGGMLTSYYSKLEKNDEQAQKLAEYEILGGGWRRLQTWIDDLSKVKPEDVQRVSNTYLKNFHFAAIGSASQFDRELFMSR
jgi:zinc protease